MFQHIKETQSSSSVYKPDVRFTKLLFEQIGGPNGDLGAPMQYFVDSFSNKKPNPSEYDALMDIATEVFSHLEIVEATIEMLLTDITGKLKHSENESDLIQFLNGTAAIET